MFSQVATVAKTVEEVRVTIDFIVISEVPASHVLANVATNP